MRKSYHHLEANIYKSGKKAEGERFCTSDLGARTAETSVNYSQDLSATGKASLPNQGIFLGHPLRGCWEGPQRCH